MAIETEAEFWNNKYNLAERCDLEQHYERMAAINNRLIYETFTILKPEWGIEGDKYFVLYGQNIQSGVSGFGNCLDLAIKDWYKNLTQTTK